MWTWAQLCGREGTGSPSPPFLRKTPEGRPGTRSYEGRCSRHDGQREEHQVWCVLTPASERGAWCGAWYGQAHVPGNWLCHAVWWEPRAGFDTEPREEALALEAAVDRRGLCRSGAPGLPERCSWVARAGPRSRSIRAAVTGHRRPGQTGQTVPSHGAGGWKSAGQVLWWRLSLACRQPPARCPPSMGRERRSPFLSSDGKGAHPCGFVTSSEPSFPARATPPSPIALKVEFQPMNLFIFIFFGGGAGAKHSVPNT